MEPCTPPNSSKSSDGNKAMYDLMKTMIKLQSSSKDKQESKPSSSRRKRIKFEDNQPRITSFLNKENQGAKRPKQMEQKLKPLDVTVESKKSEKKSKSSKTWKRNPSFEKYGIAMPSFEKIVADQKKFEEHKDSVKQLDVFDEDILEKSLAADCLLDTGKFTGELLDCKYLSLEDLDGYFKKYVQYLSDIISGKKFSERHDRYHKVGVREVSWVRDLRCSASLVVYSQEQKDHLLDLMRSKFDPEDKLTSYFFKVLLPELCLLIFMDEHGMSKRKATAYLDERPLDI